MAGSAMLEHIDLAKKISKAAYKEIFPEMETRMGALQREARAAGVPVILVFEGWDAAGKGRLINRLTQGLDPRGFEVHAISAPNEVERFYPWLWRFWNNIPANGRFAVFDRSWYGRVLVARMEHLIDVPQWRDAYEEINQFERQLADAGVVIVKFWLHISRKEQKSRLEALKKDPALSFKAGKEEWRQNKDYDRWLLAVEEMLERTSTACAPWHVIEATQNRFARVKVVETILGALRQELDRRAAAPETKPAPMPEPADSPTTQQTILDQVDLGLSLQRDAYREQLDELQDRLLELEHRLFLARVPAVIVYEGQDAAGKGGNIRRLTQGLDPRGYAVVPIAAPNDEEKARHYLWRFWREVPKAGHIAIFDRSWYGRVLVERVEGFCTDEEWKRAYREINEFERQLADFGTVIVKFWLQIDRDEQLRRFESRQENPFKRWKITDEDWRNREKWDRYKVAIVDMLQKTSTTYAPWTILEANCKLHARVKALRTVADALERGLERHQ
jgi:polyphosphate:AMP phosphotransferase